MEKMIDGRLFNTDDAIEVAAFLSPLANTDPYWCEEALHRTDDGKWLLWGSGGVATRWWVDSPEALKVIQGENLLVLSDIDALNWAHDHKITLAIICAYIAKAHY